MIVFCIHAMCRIGNLEVFQQAALCFVFVMLSQYVHTWLFFVFLPTSKLVVHLIDLREEPNHHQELWHLAPLPEQNRLPQHVQGVP
jgi:hypothetical protein